MDMIFLFRFIITFFLFRILTVLQIIKHINWFVTVFANSSSIKLALYYNQIWLFGWSFVCEIHSYIQSLNTEVLIGTNYNYATTASSFEGNSLILIAFTIKLLNILKIFYAAYCNFRWQLIFLTAEDVLLDSVVVVSLLRE